MFFERLLQRSERIPRRQPFHRGDLGPISLYRQHQTGAHRSAIMLHRAAATHAMLAADMRAG